MTMNLLQNNVLIIDSEKKCIGQIYMGMIQGLTNLAQIKIKFLGFKELSAGQRKNPFQHLRGLQMERIWIYFKPFLLSQSSYDNDDYNSAKYYSNKITQINSSTYYLLNNILNILPCLNCKQTCEVEPVIVIASQVQKLRQREVKSLY